VDAIDWTYISGLFVDGDLWAASGTVICLSLLTWTIGLVLGLGVALAKQSRLAALRVAASGYVWFFRSLPLLVLLIFVYNLPQLFPSISGLLSQPFWAGLFAMVLSETAYIAEIHRGGLLGVPSGQDEAGRALGIGYVGRLRLIKVPQSIRIALPTLANELITIVKLTSLVSVISLAEILLVGQRLYTQNFKVIETLFAVAIYYVLIVSVFSTIISLLERRLDVSRRHQTEAGPAATTAENAVRLMQPKVRQQQSDETVLELKGIGKSFGAKRVLDDVSLKVRRGEVISIIGPSGSGKTTLIRTVNALQDIDAGRISLHGRDWISAEDGIYRIAPGFNDRVTDVGMVFQSFNLFPHLTALDNVEIGPRYHGAMPRDRIEEAALGVLRKVGMEQHAGKYPHQLSGGQQQRVAIARALAMDPDIMLFDEPTSALDPELVNEVLAAIEILANEGKTMIIVTHEMRFALKVSNRVVFMESGRIVSVGTPAELQAEPAGSRVTEFLRQSRH
jgi:polar amino acid transport system permease protein